MENKEAFDALIAKMSMEENTSSEDILEAASYLNDCEMAQVYELVKDQFKKERPG